MIVPENLIEDVQIALGKGLGKITIGDPNNDQVRMGALVNKKQQEVVRAGIDRFLQDHNLLFGHPDEVQLIDADAQQGAFMAPLVFLNERPFEVMTSHNEEVFGPVSTLMPYRNMDEAIELTNLGKGSLVSSIATMDAQVAKAFVLGSGAYNGRILILNEKSAPESTGHGSPMPTMQHGGPGRAGGGEELGGMRGLKLYLQRVALQGNPTMLTQITGQYQRGADRPESRIHPFQKSFHELNIGDTYTTHNHTVTEADIVNFANVSGDHFYAHVDATSLEGTTFERRVAHGYYILSKAAGMFVHPKKGPVLLNYGLDEARFIKPVYPGMTLGVKLTCQEKLEQEQRDDEDFRKGIVKWQVDITDETGETVALAVILTMVKIEAHA